MRIVDLKRVLMLSECSYKIHIVAFELNSRVSTVWNSIHQVEEKLGYRIFSRRGPDYIGLTEKGKEAIKQIRNILRDYKELDLR